MMLAAFLAQLKEKANSSEQWTPESALAQELITGIEEKLNAVNSNVNRPGVCLQG